jgi:hypothetical protein
MGRIMPPIERSAAAARRIGEVLADPAASGWLKAALAAAERRDPVDAAADAHVLHALLEARCAAILADSAEAMDAPLLPLA